jgi:hypothetical protein
VHRFRPGKRHRLDGHSVIVRPTLELALEVVKNPRVDVVQFLGLYLRRLPLEEDRDRPVLDRLVQSLDARQCQLGEGFEKLDLQRIGIDSRNCASSFVSRTSKRAQVVVVLSELLALIDQERRMILCRGSE